MNSRIRGVLSVGPLGAMALEVKLTCARVSSVMETCPGIHGAGGDGVLESGDNDPETYSLPVLEKSVTKERKMLITFCVLC